MANWTYFYLIRIEFLGFRYHGWQKQPGLKTVEGFTENTLNHVLNKKPFRIIGCGRTDAMVSADDYAFELFTMEAFEIKELVKRLNENFPADIKALSAKEVSSKFNVIRNAKIKEYHYHFSFGEKTNPKWAPFIRYFREDMNIEKMKSAALLFIGDHNFRGYVTEPSENTQLKREILNSEIIPSSDKDTPENTFIYKVKSKGFMRYQVRHMMGALLEVGRENWTSKHILNSISTEYSQTIRYIAPAAGLRLHKTLYE